MQGACGRTLGQLGKAKSLYSKELRTPAYADGSPRLGENFYLDSTSFILSDNRPNSYCTAPAATDTSGSIK